MSPKNEKGKKSFKLMCCNSWPVRGKDMSVSCQRKGHVNGISKEMSVIKVNLILVK
jgi:hypothetical protein